MLLIAMDFFFVDSTFSLLRWNKYYTPPEILLSMQQISRIILVLALINVITIRLKTSWEMAKYGNLGENKYIKKNIFEDYEEYLEAFNANDERVASLFASTEYHCTLAAHSKVSLLCAASEVITLTGVCIAAAARQQYELMFPVMCIVAVVGYYNLSIKNEIESCVSTEKK